MGSTSTFGGFVSFDPISTSGHQRCTSCSGERSFEPSLTFVQLSVRVVREPQNAGNKSHTKTSYFADVWGTPVQPFLLIFGTALDLADIIIRAKFCIDRFKGFGLSKDESWGFPYETAMAL